MRETRAMIRLAAYRKKAADWKVKQPTMTHYHDWRHHVRPVTKSNGGTWQALDSMKRMAAKTDRAYFCDDWPAGIRDLGDIHDIRDVRIDHTGWYADNFQDSKVVGRVLQLPARNGKPRYIPGTYNTGCDGVTIYPLDWYEDVSDAARMADRYAELQAEDEREHDAEFQAQSQTEDLKERIVGIRAELRELVREMKALRTIAPESAYKSICVRLRADIVSLRRESHKAHKRIKALADNNWLAVEC